MATLKATLLSGSKNAYVRPSVAAYDTALTALPAPSATPLVVNSVTLAKGDRVILSALTNGQANWVFTQVETFTSGSLMYSLVPATDGRNPAYPAAPTFCDCIGVLEGTDTNLVLGWTGTAWTSLDSL